MRDPALDLRPGTRRARCVEARRRAPCARRRATAAGPPRSPRVAAISSSAPGSAPGVARRRRLTEPLEDEVGPRRPRRAGTASSDQQARYGPVAAGTTRPPAAPPRQPRRRPGRKHEHLTVSRPPRPAVPDPSLNAPASGRGGRSAARSGCAARAPPPAAHDIRPNRVPVSPQNSRIAAAASSTAADRRPGRSHPRPGRDAGSRSRRVAAGPTAMATSTAANGLAEQAAEEARRDELDQ